MPMVVSPEWLVECARQGEVWNFFPLLLTLGLLLCFTIHLFSPLGKSVPEGPFLRNSNQSDPKETEEAKQFVKPRAPSISGTVGGSAATAGKVSAKPSVSDIPEVALASAMSEFDEEDILSQYGSQKPANDETVLAAPPTDDGTTAKINDDAAAAPSATHHGDFETFDDFTACEEAAVAAVAGPSDTDTAPAPPVVPLESTTPSTSTNDNPNVTAATNNATSTTTMAEESESQFDSQDSMLYDVFKNLRIALLGFNEEEVRDLSELIEGSQGTIVTSTPTSLNGPEADYLIVPIQVG